MTSTTATRIRRVTVARQRVMKAQEQADHQSGEFDKAIARLTEDEHRAFCETIGYAYPMSCDDITYA